MIYCNRQTAGYSDLKIRQQLRQHFSINVYNMAYLVSAAMKLHLGKILSLVNCGVTNTAVLSVLPRLHNSYLYKSVTTAT